VNRKELNILASPGFLLGLGLLLLNDFLFKPLFHNWLTGKLSDFAGLFVFPLFWVALFPRSKRVIYLLTAILFTFWKSSYSQPIIDFSSQWLSLPINRTIDLTDLLALSVLPISYMYCDIKHRVLSYKYMPYFIAFVSLFAFTATQFRHVANYKEKEYAFTEPKAELVAKAVRLDERDDTFKFRANYPHKPSENPTNEFYIDLKLDFCDRRGMATVEIQSKSAGSIMTLKEISYPDNCNKLEDNKERLLSTFERDFIGKLRMSEPPPNNR
jgi:hypothetical protein